MSRRRPATWLAIAIVAFAATPASAIDVAHKLANGKPEKVLTSKRPFYEIERCIVTADLPFTPVVYRTPDKPDNSLLLLGPNFNGSAKFWELRNGDEGTVTVLMWGGTHWEGVVANCL